jgi:hypothetical protein
MIRSVEDSEAKRSPTGPNPTNTLRLAEFTLRGNCAQNQRRYPQKYPEFRDLIVAAKTAGVLRTSALGTWVGSEWEKLMMVRAYACASIALCNVLTD